MIQFEPYEVCPIANTCEYRTEFLDSDRLLCNGCNPDRDIVFVCDFYKPREELVPDCLKAV